MTTGFLLFVCGLAGAAATLLAVVVYVLLARRARRRLKRELDEIYRL